MLYKKYLLEKEFALINGSRFKLLSLFLFVILVLFSVNGYSACSWSGDTGLAASCGVADINNCISDASSMSGVVTIKLPTCSTSWSTNLSINMSTGFTNVTKLNIIGAGEMPSVGAATSSGSTITLSGTQLVFTGISDKKFRISNITFSGTAETNYGAVKILGTSKYSSGGGWRVDHITFNNAPTRALAVSGYTYGVVDHVLRPGAGQVFNVSEGGATAGNASWNRSLKLGSTDAVYFEDNDVQCTGTCASPIMFCDITDGGRVVIRHNTIQNHYIGGHDASSVNRGVMSIESYDNTLRTTGYQGAGAYGLRGGTGVHFNNTLISTQNSSTDAFFETERPYGMPMMNYRSSSCASTSGLWVNKCNTSTSAVKGLLGVGASYSDSTCSSGTGCEIIDNVTSEGTTVGKGWPCRDQIGRTAGQASLPVLWWGNTIKFGSNATIAATPHAYSCASNDIQANRDYCEASDTCSGLTCKYTCGSVTIDYEAYTYPHPLTNTPSLYIKQ